MTEETDTEAGTEGVTEQNDETATEAIETKTEGEVAAAEGEAKPVEEKPKQTPWFQKRIDELTAEKYAERAAKDQLTRENEALKALVAKPDTEAQAAEKPETAAKAPDDFEKAVEARVAAQMAQQSYNSQAQAVWNSGVEMYGAKFPEAIGNLDAAGVGPKENLPFIQTAFATEAPGQLLYALGSDPEEAMRIASLPPTQMAIAMDRMARELKATTPKTSAAPAPIAPVNGVRAAKTFDPADTSSDMKTWMEQREKQLAKKRA